MPGPSGGGSNPTATPTNTPTNTPTGPTATPTNTPTPAPNAPPAYDISMSYDALGNPLSKTGVGSYQFGSNLNGTGVGPHQARLVNGATYSYDANRNLKSAGGWSYTTNPDNTLASMTNGSAPESHIYDADGERVVRTAGGVTIVYFEGLWEQTTAGARKLYYTFNGQVVAMRDSRTGAVRFGDVTQNLRTTLSSLGMALGSLQTML